MTISISWGLVSPPKGDHNHHEKKAKTPSEGEGNDVLWPENNNNEIQKIWAGRIHSGAPAKYAEHTTLSKKKKIMVSKH